MSAAPRRFPASIGQRLMWLLERHGGTNGALNIISAFRIEGPLQVEALLDALRSLMARHDSLRTTFHGRPPSLTQEVHSQDQVPDHVIELVNVSNAALSEAIKAEARRRFDLQAEWPCRIRVFCVDKGYHILTIAIHHIATDGWSMSVLLDDLTALYALRIGRRTEPLGHPVWQIGDFAIREQRCLDNGSFDMKLAYWRAALGRSQPAELPSVLRQPAANREKDNSSIKYAVPTDVGRLFADAARQYRSTYFAVLFAAFAGYYAACSQLQQLAFPVFLANRAKSELQRTVGYITSLVLLPIDLAGQPTFPEMISRARRVVLTAIANQEVPYHIVPAPEGAPLRRRHPEVVIEYRSAAGSDQLELAGTGVTPYELIASTRFAVEFHVVRSNDELNIDCIYDTDLTCTEAVIEFLNGFVKFARHLAVNAQCQ